MKNNTNLDIFSLLSDSTLGIMMSGDDALREHIMTSMKAKALAMHKAPITQGKGADKRWVTQLPDKTKAGGRRTVRKQTKEEVEEVVIAFYLEKLKYESESAIPRDITVSELYLKWVAYVEKRPKISSETIRKYRNDYKRLVKDSEFGKMLVVKVDYIDIEQYLIETTQEFNLKIRALGNLFGYLKGVFDFAMRNRLLPSNPCLLVDMKNVRPYCNDEVKEDTERVLSDADISALLQRLHERHQSHPLYMADYAIEFCLYTGLRVGEVVALKWSSIQNGQLLVTTSEHRMYHDDKASTYEIGKTKNGKKRKIPLSQGAMALLEQIRQLQDEYGIESEFIFHNGDRRIPAPEVSKAMYRRGLESGIGAKSVHAIRRTVSSKLNTRLPRATVALIMGHTEEVNTGHYDYDVVAMTAKTDAMNSLMAI